MEAPVGANKKTAEAPFFIQGINPLWGNNDPVSLQLGIIAGGKLTLSVGIENLLAFLENALDFYTLPPQREGFSRSVGICDIIDRALAPFLQNHQLQRLGLAVQILSLIHI